MTVARYAVASVLALLTLTSGAQAQAPSYARDVRPFLAKYCLECHNSRNAKAALNLETFQGLLKGSEDGPVLVAGKPDESPLVVLVESKGKLRMPPETVKRRPKAAEVAVLRAWVKAGAKDDSTDLKAFLPDVKPRVPTAPPVAALAYRPDGKALVAAGYNEALLIDPAAGTLTGKLPAPGGGATALAFSRDGRFLAVASGVSGVGGQIRLYPVGPDGNPAAQPARVLTGHADLIHDLAFSPDGKLLASCGYDKLIKVWDTASGKEVRTLREHSDSVYAVAFSPDGKLLASAAADRAVKLWEAATGRLLYTLGEPTDWVYAVAWSPNGRELAAAGADRSIRVWEATATGNKLLHSAFAHEAPVIRLAYSADGKVLYSLAENRQVKAWDAARLVERKVYPPQPESVLALAVRPDRGQLALGRYDGALVLMEEGTGKVQAQPLPVKPKPPQAKKLTPDSGTRGKAVRVTVTGANLDAVSEGTINHPGATVRLLPEGRTASTLQAELTFPPTTPAGVYQLTLKSPAGPGAPLPFTVDLFDPVAETEPNDSPGTGQNITLPATVVGSLNRTGDVDFFRFEAKAGQQVGVQVLTAAVGSKVAPSLRLTDAGGQVLAESDNGALGHTCTKAGTYAIGVRDQEHRGGPAMHYRLHVGDVPVITAVFPLGLQRGTEAEIRVEGVHLGKATSVRVKAPADAAPGTTIPLPVTTPLGAPLNGKSVVVGEFPEAIATADRSPPPHPPPLPLPLPPRVGEGSGVGGGQGGGGTANGRIADAGASQTWRFTAKKGQRLIVEVNARRLGSELDSTIEILDLKGRPVPRATLRSLARTFVTFRDHDSASPGIRIETWGEFAMNDYVLIGGELLRIRELPPNPDADCTFFSQRGQRVGYLDTTPTHHAQGTPIYKVALHPPGTTFPPNGFPVVTLYYRNDDGGPDYGRDSRLSFDAPADGDYQVRITDSRGQGGPNYAYRLTVRPPRPSYTISFSPTAPAVWKGGAVPLTVSADRIDGYEGEIKVRLEHLPPGFRAPATSIPAGENSTAFALYAEPGAKTPGKLPPLRLVAEAVIGGEKVVKEATGGLPRVVEPGDLVTTTVQSEVTLGPGGQTKLLVKVERRNGFKGRIPLDVRGLPHGVRVLDIGLNGILITERESQREVVLYAEPWVRPQEHPFVVLARREGKNSEHAAPSVLLKVAAGR
jgi:WD40 repeat protein